ncbi:hypothetical protein RBU49_06255 [Clostridium sp. MB40-C1]|uniref:hypothetical protein n=1 Tax=Clostridium sp. MB40-C1 TaxID=3070996 RepID=UPI0027E05241|nr:hypothetical protein [Clostridium sp. MB40-C1]WMJ81846.1 hypothetical protein RBU49_06255 [Clostridium sp. MB40-C1]
MDSGPSPIIDKYYKNKIKNTITIKDMVLVGAELNEERFRKNIMSYQGKKIHRSKENNNKF